MLTETVIARGRRWPSALPRVAVCVGLVVIVVGTFLPWLHSGRATRNSYATDGAVRRLLDVNGAVDAGLRAWPFVSLICALAAALVVLGRPRAAGALAVLAAVCAGGVSAWALLSDGSGLIRPATAGPAATLTGAVVTCLAVLACASPIKHVTGRGSA